MQVIKFWGHYLPLGGFCRMLVPCEIFLVGPHFVRCQQSFYHLGVGLITLKRIKYWHDWVSLFFRHLVTIFYLPRGGGNSFLCSAWRSQSPFLSEGLTAETQTSRIFVQLDSDSGEARCSVCEIYIKLVVLKVSKELKVKERGKKEFVTSSCDNC